VTKNWSQLIIGMLLLISPWILGFSDISLARWCNVLFGLILILTSFWELFAGQSIKKEMTVEKTTKHKK
jgi:hypothetical protein